MSDAVRSAHDLSALVAAPKGAKGRVSGMVERLRGSEILRISGEIRTLVASGQPVCDLTVGDFSPRYFPIPVPLRDGIQAALGRGETNYPPAPGLGELREAVRLFYARELERWRRQTRIDYVYVSALASPKRQRPYTAERLDQDTARDDSLTVHIHVETARASGGQ